MTDDNRRRARRARHALAAYRAVADDGNDDEEILSDLIADLGHHADTDGIDFVDCCARAIGAWALERKGEHAAPTTPSVVIGGEP